MEAWWYVEVEVGGGVVVVHVVQIVAGSLMVVVDLVVVDLGTRKRRWAGGGEEGECGLGGDGGPGG